MSDGKTNGNCPHELYTIRQIKPLTKAIKYGEMTLKNKTWYSLKFFDNEKIAIQNLNVSMLYTCFFKINDFFIITGYIYIL